MRKINVTKWSEKSPEGIEYSESILSILGVLVTIKKPDEMPKGLEYFKLMQHISLAFVKAEKSGVLELEELDYSFLKKIIEKDVPCVWGLNPNIVKAVDEFMNVKEE